MNKIAIKINAVKKVVSALLVTLLLQFTTPAQAKLIDLRSEEKTFGDWKVFCEIDDMLNIAHCEIASKFYKNTAVITIQATRKFANQFFVIIPQIEIGTFVTMRIDQNDVLLSANVRKKNFGLMPFSERQKNMMFSQMKSGNFLFLRFTPVKSVKEITARLSLKDFRRALSYYNKKTSNN
jgi:invasion protein IalB